MKDYEVTCVPTKTKYDIFTLDLEKYKNTRAHSESCFTVLDIQSGFSKFSGFYKRVVSISRDSIFNLAFASICKR